MHNIIDKKQCLLNIIEGKITLDDDNIYVVGLEDMYIEPLGCIEIETMRFLIEQEDILFIK